MNPPLGSRIEEAVSLGICADYPDEFRFRDAVVNPQPCSPIIRRLEEQGRIIPQPIAVGGDICCRRTVRRRFDDGDGCPLRQVGWCHLAPVLSAVLRNMDEPVVRPGPKHPALVRRLREREYRPVVLHERGVLGYGAARRLHLRTVIASQIGADCRPTVPLIGGSEDDLGRHVQRTRIVRREHERVRPLKSVLVILHPRAVYEFWPNGYDFALPSSMVVSVQRVAAARRASDGAGEYDVRIFRMYGDLTALGTSNEIAVREEDRSLFEIPTRRTDRAIVLLRGVQTIRVLVIRVHTVELSRWLIVDRRPGRAPVERNARPSVVPLDHAHGIRRIDPQIVVVSMRGRYFSERAPSVRRLPAFQIQHPYRFRILRVCEDVRVVPGTLKELGGVGGQFPRFPPVVGAIQAPVFRLDDRPDASEHRGGNCYPHTSLQSAGKPFAFGDVVPGVAAVGRAKDGALRSARREIPRFAPRLPQRREHDPRIVGIHRQVCGSAVVAPVQDVIPRLASIPGAKYPAFLVAPKDIAQGRNVHEIRIRRMDSHARNVLGCLQPHMRP